jgi:hypothetical protein
MKLADALFEASRDPQNLRARRPTWNDESACVLYKGHPLLMIGGRPSPNCELRNDDWAADDWEIVPA